MAAVQKGFRLPKDVVELLSVMPNATEYVVNAVREKAARDREQEIAAGLECLAWNDEANDISDLRAAQARVMSIED